MKILNQASELKPGKRKVCVAIGVFDGIHLGHQQVIRQTISDAEQHEAISVVVTFDCHPSAVVAPERTPPLIYPLEKKVELIRSLGAETMLMIHFDRAFSQIPAEEFVRHLASGFGQIQSVAVGSNFTFGHKRGGNVDLLKRLGTELNFLVHGLAAVSLDNERVSSTRIREAIAKGNIDGAGQMLGRAYELCGKVVEGDQLGRKIGFPTANLDVSGLVLPPNGVYAIHAQVGRKLHRAVLNIGFRPTLSNPTPQLRVEAHLLDFNRNIYGERVAVSFVEKLREEKRFPSAGALREQIGKDIEAATRLF